MCEKKAKRPRINRYLASCGVASRRGAEKLVQEGRVVVNGEVLHSLSYCVRPSDRIFLDGREVRENRQRYYLYHKPRGFLCAHHDPQGRDLIYQQLPQGEGLFSVGRLDYDSEGLLLITNDGDFAQTYMHPSYAIEKEYFVLLDRPWEHEMAVAKTITHMGVTYRWDAMAQLSKKRKEQMQQYIDHPSDWNDPRRCLSITVHEGKKREVRMIFKALGYEVQRLVRWRQGEYVLDMPSGTYRSLQ